MRLALALLTAAGVWATSCSVLPPCASLRPGLTVALAEVLEDHPASSSAPIRLKLRTLAYGPSPGAEFTYPAAESEEVRTGDLYYIEGSIPFQRGPCET